MQNFCARAGHFVACTASVHKGICLSGMLPSGRVMIVCTVQCPMCLCVRTLMCVYPVVFLSYANLAIRQGHS